MTHKTIQTVFFLTLLTGALVLLFFIIKPFFSSLVLAFTFAIVFYPIHRRLVSLFGGRKSVASFTTILLILLVVLLPLFFLGAQVFSEGRSFYLNNQDISRFLEIIPVGHSAMVQEWVLSFTSNLNYYLQQGIAWGLTHVGDVFSSIAQFFLSVVISLIATYFLLKEGPELKKKLIHISPLSDRFDRQIIDRLQLAVSTVIRGALVIAVIQGILSGIGFTLTGVPNPALWGTVTMFASLIPGIGTALVMIPCVLYLVLSGHLVMGIVLALWGTTAVGLIDNFLSPYLVGRGVKIHGFIIMLSVLGGLGIFGPVGFLMGPLVVSFLFALLDIYPMLILHEER